MNDLLSYFCHWVREWVSHSFRDSHCIFQACEHVSLNRYLNRDPDHWFQIVQDLTHLVISQTNSLKLMSPSPSWLTRLNYDSTWPGGNCKLTWSITFTISFSSSSVGDQPNVLITSTKWNHGHRVKNCFSLEPVLLPQLSRRHLWIKKVFMSFTNNCSCQRGTCRRKRRFLDILSRSPLEASLQPEPVYVLMLYWRVLVSVRFASKSLPQPHCADTVCQ